MSDHEQEHVTYFGRTNFRNQMTKFGIKTDDRRRHMYVIGKTGMGKTTLLENMILDDIYNGHGCCYVDPHGDTAEKLINYIPNSRINDVVYFNPSDIEYPIGFNMLEAVDESHKHLMAAGMMSVFKKIWENAWSSRMEYILNNTLLALLDNPGTTLLGINRLLSDADYRKRIVGNVKDPIVKQFWVKEFAAYNDKYAQEAVAPIQNKIGQFLSNSVIRNIVAQVKSTINMREIMDHQKIFIINLSKGRIGEDSMRLLGGMIITRVQLGAMERVDTLEEQRKDFYLYVDEFQNFAVESFASILSEARKYRLCLIMAHQYIAQLTEEVRDAVFGNVGTMITFRVGSPDAIFLEKEFAPRFFPEDIINLPKFSIYLKLLINGVTSQPFSALTLPPIGQPSGNFDKVISVSRERYAKPRDEISDKIMKWTGMEEGADVEKMYEEAADKKKAAKKSRKPNFEYDCTKCNTKINLPVELDKSRPIYCEECIELVREERKKGKGKGEKRSERKSERPKNISTGKLVEKAPKVPQASISLSALAPKEDKQKDPAPKELAEKEARSPKEERKIVKKEEVEMPSVVIEKPVKERARKEVQPGPKQVKQVEKPKQQPRSEKKESTSEETPARKPVAAPTNESISAKKASSVTREPKSKPRSENRATGSNKDRSVAPVDAAAPLGLEHFVLSGTPAPRPVQVNDQPATSATVSTNTVSETAPKKKRRRRRRKRAESEAPTGKSDTPTSSASSTQDKKTGTITSGQRVTFD